MHVVVVGTFFILMPIQAKNFQNLVPVFGARQNDVRNVGPLGMKKIIK